MDKSYFNVTFLNTEYRYSREQGQVRIPYTIPFDYCNDSFSDLVEPEIRERFSIETHLCPSTDDFYIVRDLKSEVYRGIEIFVTPCDENNNEGVT